MRNNNSLTTTADGFCFAKAGEVYVLFLREPARTSLDLRDEEGDFSIRWMGRLLARAGFMKHVCPAQMQANRPKA